MLRLNLSHVKIAAMAMRSGKSPPKPTPKPYHHGNLREALLDAAQQLLAHAGLQALSLREVAKAAGVSHAAPYHHFDSLDALLAAVGERSFAQLAQRMSEAEAGLASPRARLLAICEAYVVFAQQQPEAFRLMFGPLLARKREHPGLQDAAERAFDVLLDAANAHARRVRKPQDGPELALAGWSLAHGFAHLAIDGAFDSLPIELPDRRGLAQRLGERLLGKG
jgi:AcrR family transcriptional regulator